MPFIQQVNTAWRLSGETGQPVVSTFSGAGADDEEVVQALMLMRPLHKARAIAATDLCASILRIHPYEDGNGRVAFVALQAALLSQGIYAVWFDDVDRHDQALGWALRTDIEPDAEPFARLIIDRARAAMPDAGEGILGA